MTSVADWICQVHFLVSSNPFVNKPVSPSFPPVWFASVTNSTFPLLKKTFFLGPAPVKQHKPLGDELECSLHHKTMVSGWDKAPSKAAGRRKGRKNVCFLLQQNSPSISWKGNLGPGFKFSLKCNRASGSRISPTMRYFSYSSFPRNRLAMGFKALSMTKLSEVAFSSSLWLNLELWVGQRSKQKWNCQTYGSQVNEIFSNAYQLSPGQMDFSAWSPWMH